MKVDIVELGLAYRRAKADLYYTKHANSVKLLRFEHNLVSNLECLHKILEEECFQELLSSYCHGWRVIPKSVKMTDDDVDSKGTILVGDELRSVSQCDLRLIEDLPVQFHIVTQLWIDRLGGKFDKAMSHESYGNRIRRHGENVNKFFPGSFKYWMSQYQKWHNGGLDTIKKALDMGTNVAVLTTDFSAFFHNLSPRFILNEAFLADIGVRLDSRDDIVLTQVVVNMLEKWAATTPLAAGLPVGCTISSVIANLALTPFDRQMSSINDQVYYGRYVDDIIFAVENSSRIKTQEEFINWLCLRITDLQRDGELVCYSPSWMSLSEGCRLYFQRSKTKVFIFNGVDGKDFISGLQSQIHKRTSEWRSLPELSDDPVELVKSIIAITDNHGVEVDKLRQAEEASIRRAAFAMKLSDFSDYALCLDASDWSKQRDAFVRAVTVYFTSVKNYFELNRYFPRLLALALYGLSVTDIDSLNVIKEMLSRVANAIRKAIAGDTYVSSRNIRDLDESIDCKYLLHWQIAREFSEAVVSSVRDKEVGRIALEYIKSAFPTAAGVADDLPCYDELLLSDLAQQPYKALLFSALDISEHQYASGSNLSNNFVKIIPQGMYQNLQEFFNVRKEWSGNLLSKGAVSGFVFPTRKLSLVELFAIFPNPYTGKFGDRVILNNYLRYCSYVGLDDGDLSPPVKGRSNLITVVDSRNGVFRRRNVIRATDKKKITNIALAYWRMSEDDWKYQVNGSRNPKNSERFTRLMRLTNHMLKSTFGKQESSLDYIMYPELAIPWRWFLLMQNKVKRFGVSLISGVEYIRSVRKKMLRNEVWCALEYCGNGYKDSLLIKVLKTAPAAEEKNSLEKYGWRLDCISARGGFQAGDVIMHGHDKNYLFFSVLICSDLTDIELRNRLRGHIDLLCVPAWNQDVKTFNALVMASAHDLHAYVALCNNGEYGDTRIRAPLVDEYARDVVQLKGGDNDYWVVGAVNSNAIRRFHAGFPSAKDPKYKPLPIKFRIGKERNECVERVPIDTGVYEFRYVEIREPFLLVNLPDSAGNLGENSIKYNFSTLSTKPRILHHIGELVLKKGASADVIKEFLLACKVCVGIDIM